MTGGGAGLVAAVAPWALGLAALLAGWWAWRMVAARDPGGAADRRAVAPPAAGVALAPTRADHRSSPPAASPCADHAPHHAGDRAAAHAGGQPPATRDNTQPRQDATPPSTARAEALARDLAPGLALALLALAATARPLLSGALAGAALAGLALADATKRRVLREPLLFLDAALLREVLRHPHLYIPFAGTGRVMAAAGAAGAAAALLLALEPAGLGPGGRIAAAGAAAALLWWWQSPSALSLARDPAADSTRLGPAATLGLHAAAARAERPARRAALPPEAAPLPLPDPAPHLVLLQLESFWDARGRSPRADAPRLPGWDRLAAEALARGRLSVPGFGANTMRAEFAALTGVPDAALGLDAFNPYAAFARAPVASVAHRLAASGYATRAIHPHDRRFFGRDRVLPALGFAAFEGDDAFRDAPRTGRYVSDAALGAAIADRLARADRPLCLFAISIAAHGPWDGPDPFAAWAARMAETDAMLARLAEAARALPRPVVLLAWGDHVPSLPETARLPDWRTDWLAWHSARPGAGTRRDIAAAGLRAEAEAALGAR